MQYEAVVTREGSNYTIEFPDCVGCQTFAESLDEVPAVAREALEGWLEANLAERMVPPRPTRQRAPEGSSVVKVGIGARLSAGLQVRWARQDRGLSQGALAELVGVSQQAVAKLEDPDANPTLGTLEKVATALEMDLWIELRAPAVVATRSKVANTEHRIVVETVSRTAVGNVFRGGKNPLTGKPLESAKAATKRTAPNRMRKPVVS